MEITILCVGKIKEKYLIEGLEYYIKQVRKQCPVTIVEVNDEKAPENLSDAMEKQIKDKEGDKILRYIKEDMYVITLEILGRELSTEGFVNMIKKAKNFNKNKVCFVIGGSLGLGDNVLQRSDCAISFSKMTFPHQLMRLILIEKLAQVAPYL